MTHPLLFFRACFPPHLLRFAIGFAVVAFLLIVSTATFADDASNSSQAQWIPDTLVMVMSGMGAADYVSIAYPAQISEAEAVGDLDKLAAAGGWLLQNRETAVTPGNATGGKPATSASFRTAGIINTNSGTIKLEPFLVALKRYGKIEVIYINVPEMEFAGLKDFENKFVKITMSRQDSTYRYRTLVKDDGFDKLALPTFDASSAVQNGSASINPVLRLIAIVGIALLCAAVIYASVNRVLKKPRT